MIQRSFSRRGFMQYTAGVTGFLLSQAYGLGRNPVRVGLIGCGSRGSDLVEQIHLTPLARLEAICDIEPERAVRASEKSGAPVFHDWTDVVSHPKLDAVVLAAPDYLRTNMAVAAMEAGKDVFCVPPMGLTPADANRVRHMARKTERVFQLAMPWGRERGWAEVIRLANSGRLGSLVWAQAGTRKRTVQKIAEGRWHWRRDPRYSLGAIATEFFLDLGRLLMLCPDAIPELVAAAGGNYEHHDRENPDVLVLTCRYKDGFTLALTSAAYSASTTHPTIVRGTKGYVEYFEDKVVLRSPKGETYRRFGTTPWTYETHDALTEWLVNVRTRGRCLWNEERGYLTQKVLCAGLETLRRHVA